MVRIKALRRLIATRDVKDLTGWTIPKGATVHVIKEGPKHPTEGYKVLVIRVDNGTGMLDLMPETAVRDNAGFKAVA